MGMPRVMVMMAVLMAAMVTTERGHAAESAAVETAHTRATLVTDKDAVGPDGTIQVGLRLQLRPGWHTYWANPGDAGDAPHMAVQASGDAHDGESHVFRWPVPERINEGGLMAYAYTNHVLLPQSLSLRGGGATTLKAKADWLVCDDVCVPESGEFTLSLPTATGSVVESAQAPLFHEADAAMPQPSPFQATLSSDGVLRLEGSDVSPATIKNAWFLPLQGGVIRQTAEQPLNVTQGSLALTLFPDPSQKPPLWQSPLSGVVVMVDQSGARSAVQVTAQPQVAVPSTSHKALSGMAVVKVLLFAVLGGMILNLMPCVFPVLAMKALSLARMGGVGQKAAVESALFYAIGVIVSFGALGAVMIGLRSVGSAAGWGFQFQSPGFVIGVCWLLFVLALNLLGVFQLTIGRLAGQIDQLGRAPGRWGDLLTGLIAVIVATPCTAPFMGVAIAGALSGPIVMGLTVFLAMGVGLAAPYVLVATVSGLASRLPRPGGWMDVFKQFLAFPLLASCVWLLWVVSLQRGAGFVALAAGGAVLLALGGWLYGLAQKRRMREGGARLVAFACVAALLCVCVSVVSLGVALSFDHQKAPLSGRLDHIENGTVGAVEPFSEGRLAALRAEGTPVFIDMKASWCITCMVNERVALDVSSVKHVFAQHHVVTLRGDWTNRDEEISTYLKKQGRDGVPFYKYYPPHQEGIVLPQILTPNGVIKIITESVHH